MPWDDVSEPEPEPVSAPTASYEAPEPAKDATADAWVLPRRQAVAVRDNPSSEHAAPWPDAENLAMDDPAAQTRVPGLEAIGGFHDAAAEARQDVADAPVGEPLHPNAAWLENLYAQYMDEPEVQGKKRKKEMLDVAFAAPEQDAPAKLGTLRRLLDAIKKL